LNVLSKAGLTKDNFSEADTRQLTDPTQRDIMSYFEESFFDDDMTEGLNDGMPLYVSHGKSPLKKDGTQQATIHKYFSPSKQNSASTSANNQEETISLSDNVSANDWDENIEELWGDEDPDAPWPKKRRLDMN